MIREVIVDSMEQIAELFLMQQYNEKIHRFRSSFFFRGLPDARFSLVTSLQRNCKNLPELEKPMLRNFMNYAALEDPSLKDSVWRQLIVGQHHGLPTRLLDWTHSSMVALHFALTERNPDKMDKRDCVVWCIDARETNALLPKPYRAILDNASSFVMSADQLERIAPTLEDYDEAMGGKSLVLFEPPSIDQRIINQFSFFSVIPRGMTDIEGFLDANTHSTTRYVIRKEIRWQIRDTIDQLNMNERIFYPGLDGVTQMIARHYFVREK